ncbi:hypothetical protein BZG36_03662 [Bifiguratus adelaidae]|uniref:CCR4-NOT transcription complex subunit 11 n=1 Tax=Bifiguratus adelaidae TaxID=1938954 RepID=A0A261XZU2_9FUNG|nr:hypothetical protein BZG36_03662 [Bifiguratus adelaidae]
MSDSIEAPSKETNLQQLGRAYISQSYYSSFDVSFQKFLAQVPEEERFRALCGLWASLQAKGPHGLGEAETTEYSDEQVLQPAAYMTHFYIMYMAYATEGVPVRYHPFLSFFIEVLTSWHVDQRADTKQQSTLTVLRQFLKCMLTSKAEDLKALSPGQLFDRPSLIPPVSDPDIDALVQFVRNVDSMWDPPEEIVPISVDASLSSTKGKEPLSSHESVPEAYNVSPDILAEAVTSPLTIYKQKHILSMTEDEDWLKSVVIDPTSFANLVENNETVAAAVILKMASQGSFDSHVEALLLHHPITNNALELAFKLLLNLHGISEHNVHVFVSRCIRSCDTLSDNLQQRQVRKVTSFLSSLLQNNIIAIDDYLPELQAFCLQYSRYREATNLFQTIARRLESLR